MMKRREFLTKSLVGGAAAAAFPWLARGQWQRQSKAGYASDKFSVEELAERYARIDEASARPVFRRELFPDPVKIASLELLEHDGRYLCRMPGRALPMYRPRLSTERRPANLALA